MIGNCARCSNIGEIYARGLCVPCYKWAWKNQALDWWSRRPTFLRDTPFRVRLLSQLIINPATGCWEWSGSKTRQGYAAAIRRDGRAVSPHRAAWELWNGPIPDGLEIDHLCHTNDASCPGGPSCPHRCCCNPAHLEPVVHVINVRRGNAGSYQIAKAATITHCPKGHPYDEENTRLSPDGDRKSVV